MPAPRTWLLLLVGLLAGVTTVDGALQGCIDDINKIAATAAQGNAQSCMGCDPTLDECPTGCSQLLAR
jgi:hypothetical protein